MQISGMWVCIFQGKNAHSFQKTKTSNTVSLNMASLMFSLTNTGLHLGGPAQYWGTQRGQDVQGEHSPGLINNGEWTPVEGNECTIWGPGSWLGWDRATPGPSESCRDADHILMASCWWLSSTTFKVTSQSSYPSKGCVVNTFLYLPSVPISVYFSKQRSQYWKIINDNYNFKCEIARKAPVFQEEFLTIFAPWTLWQSKEVRTSKNNAFKCIKQNT